MSVQIVETQCKSILTRTSGYLKEVCSHSLNPYVGCGFGLSSCGEGCYVRFNQWLTRERVWGQFVDVKLNAADVYRQTRDSERKWAHKRGRQFAIFFSSSTDPWQPLETKYRISRSVLQAMKELPPDQLILQTHTARIEEDLPLIRDLTQLCELRVHVSIEGDRDRLPGLPPPPCSLEGRLRVLEEFSKAGIKTVACLSPLYPLIDPEAFFSRLAGTGIAAVVIDHFIEGDGTPDGSRTFKTKLPQVMAQEMAESVQLSYRDKVAGIARVYLPVGLSCSGFSGVYTSR